VPPAEEYAVTVPLALAVADNDADAVLNVDADAVIVAVCDSAALPDALGLADGVELPDGDASFVGAIGIIGLGVSSACTLSRSSALLV
jgi:hypothetical protein